MPNLEQLKIRAGEMAKGHEVSPPGRKTKYKLPKLEEDNQVLIQAHKSTSEEIKSKGSIIPAAEWLLDNFYVIEEQFKEIQHNLTRDLYRDLPVLAKGKYAGFPRIYGIASEMTDFLDGKIEEDVILQFLDEYQTTVPLTCKELWAFPLMLRISLLEKIKDIAAYISESIKLKKLADEWADRLIGSLARSREDSGLRDDFRKTIIEHDEKIGVMKPVYAERLLQRLREEGADTAPIIRWLDGKLAVQHTGADEVVLLVHQTQASKQGSMGNAVTSLRVVSSMKWEELFEELSILDRILKQDPAGIYPLMDFASRDYYRHMVERIAKKFGVIELQAAEAVLDCARENKDTAQEKLNHVGYYIIDRGRSLLEAKLSGKKPSGPSGGRNQFLYFGSIGLLTGLTMLLFLYGIRHTSSGAGFGSVLLAAILAFLPILSISVGLVHWFVTRICKPFHVPKLELKEGIPEKFRTMVVIPTLLTSEQRAIELIEQMEVFYLANQEKNLHFALIGDYKDGPAEKTESDASIVETAKRLIRELNERYGQDRQDIFYFFHRHRQWNPNQKSWMGWERKRGALVEFNALLAGSKNTSYSIQEGDLSVLGKIVYVITLDADTQLPRDAAKKLIGAIAHPLNKPVLSEDGTRVVEGYGLLQPRIGVSVDSASRSFFSLTFSGQTGVDPYTTAVSDVYQDLFREGIFTGKGIYRPDIFNQVLRDAIPENSVLSHDLLEGSYVRAGLVTDIELIDGYPAHYIGYSQRLHRWVRGDWQLLPWLRRRIRNKKGDWVENPLNAISKWKVMDNMRRSLLPPALYLMIVLSFLILPGAVSLWLALAFLTLLFPLVTDLAGKLLSQKSSSYKKRRLASVFEGTRSLLLQIFLTFVFLAHQAYIMLDAVVRSAWRVTVSGKNMLEWVTAADSDRKFRGEMLDYWHKMKEPVYLSIVFFLTAAFINPSVWVYSLLVTILWVCSPYIAYQVSKPKSKRIPMLSREQVHNIRRIARKTWKYFDELVNEQENWLPPDNYQQEPPVGVAHRTSPTNIGLHLMSVLAARDLGYIGTLDAVQRLENTIKTMHKLEKWNGHYYNWYNTLTLEPLRPLYVSTVDNGNLIGYLITLSQGVDELMKRSLIGRENIIGLRDVLAVDCGKEDLDRQSLLNMLLASDTISVTEWQMLLDDLKGQGEALDRIITGYEKEAELFIPWVKLLQKIPAPLLNEKGVYKNTAQKMSELLHKLNGPLSLQGIYDNYLDILKSLSETYASLNRDANRAPGYTAARSWLKELEIALAGSHSAIKDFIARCRQLRREIDSIIKGMDFKLLYDEKRELFSIGFNVEDGQLTNSYYDLLASEARQASFIAIAKGDIPQKHWFKLGRPLSLVGDLRVLISWSGTMFEYLMPLLIMKNYENTLLDETYGAVVRGQRQYAERHHIPWGISESGFYAFDLHLNYQYKAFGIPHLGLKRGLVNDMVIAPYASVLALPVEPAMTYRNMEGMMADGLEGPYGFYEAVDYTPERMPKKRKSMIIKSFMAHHQGMSLIAINNYLNNNIMQARFHSVPMIKATELLLQERMPRREIFIKEYEDIDMPDLEEGRHYREIQAKRTYRTPNTVIPETALLSNGNYTVMLTNSGGGFSQCMGQAVTRWREDVTRDDWGMMFYITNLNSNNFWSAGFHPAGILPEEYKVTFEPDRAEFNRKDGNIETKMEIVVSPEYNGEVRRISLTNLSSSSRIMEVTSYFEAVLAPFAADRAHPAFSNLFVQTEFLPEWNTLLATRRPRDKKQKPLWVFHTAVVEGDSIGSIQYETDRSKFIGRGRTLRNPQVMEPEFPLSNTTGAVLDPIISIRRRVSIAAGETVKVSFITGVTDSKEAAVALARDCQSSNVYSRAMELAWTHSQVELRYLNLTAGQANLFQTMASQILYTRPPFPWKQDMIMKNRKGQTALWAYGISGDMPIIILRIGKLEHIEMVRQMLTAHEYMRLKGLMVDMVVLNEYGNSYEQPVNDRLRELIAISHARDLLDKPGGVFIRQSSNIPEEDMALLFSAARLVLNGDDGSIADQLTVEEESREISLLETREADYRIVSAEETLCPRNLLYQNDTGGFSEDGREYIICLKDNAVTPLPWSNIIANPVFGFLVTESGSGYTFCKNSRENKLTPWSNDPVRDPAGEALFIRDDETGDFWTITRLPVHKGGEYLIRHGQGYTVFEHNSHGLYQRQSVFVPLEEPVKLIHTALKNNTDQQRKLSLFFYAEWVLGVNRDMTAPFIATEFSKDNNCMLAYNPYNEEFAGRAAFVSSSLDIQSFTSDRKEFIGRNSSLEEPAAMAAKRLSNLAGAGFDPCSAIQVQLELGPGEEKALVFLLGQGENTDHAEKICNTYRSVEKAESALKEAKAFWDQKLGILQVKTPDPSMDLLLNRWLVYQTYACRVLARTGFYQAGGAYGFRDQLQDVLALLYSAPERTREQILLAAAHQFLEGDVQHWWHPPVRGVRTRITDDLLFLPFVTADYIEGTGDWGILDEQVGFLESEPLKPEEHDRYSVPAVSEETACIYDHCVRAIERSMQFGSHGLPLMGGGDWNDGMDKVGIEGKGESVWLGWFLLTVLKRFIPICKARGDMERAVRYEKTAEELRENIESNAWDGGWYRRAYFDDGTPLGSEMNEECRIDSISQSWAVISAGGRPERVREAMRALQHYLVVEDEGLIKLLTPPFDVSSLEPGYIKGYVPGVRENGGQYTHAAVWAVMAIARMGDGNKAWRLYHLINPINHTRTCLDVSKYKAEPYVMAADVYAVSPHTGRGGWTWYTGSSSWMYRVGIGEILGFKRKGSSITLDPCIPVDWHGFTMEYIHGSSKYVIQVENPTSVSRGISEITLDGTQLDGIDIPLVDDGKEHIVTVTMGAGV
jgi:cyclic beta-1,2-glucan synthetase